MSPILRIKDELQQIIREAHRVLMRRQLPRKVALYLHSLEESTWDAFAETAGFFKDQGYEFVGPNVIHEPRTTPAAFISFDDNYQSWHHALGLLETLEVKATFYINTLPFRDRATREVINAYYDRIAHTGDRTPLSSSEIVDLADHGHTIGCHTRSHSNLRSLSEIEAHREIRKGKEELEDILGQPVEHFSYPFGFRRHFRSSLRYFCSEIGLRTVANATPALLFRRQRPLSLDRSVWHLDRPLEYNLDNLRIDGRLFTVVTGRSAVG